MACADMKSAVTVLYFIKPAIRQNSYGLYIVEKCENKIMERIDSILCLQDTI